MQGLYEVTETVHGRWDEAYGLALWANSPGEAVDLFLKECPGDLAEADVRWRRYDDSAITPSKLSPHVEKRDEVLRALGWRYECDDLCESCDLYTMDGLFPVCPTCSRCEECGCVCGEEAT